MIEHTLDSISFIVKYELRISNVFACDLAVRIDGLQHNVSFESVLA